ncbi:hypothetical protein Slala03_78770 [Streptomyces lavendulae subsp. lavendulae]|nr:hypothetical protein Slala03_78770 [Streptomyces lavendulae subsp. lavendulae]
MHSPAYDLVVVEQEDADGLRRGGGGTAAGHDATPSPGFALDARTPASCPPDGPSGQGRSALIGRGAPEKEPSQRAPRKGPSALSEGLPGLPGRGWHRMN